jgi:hypothetical protein
MIKKWKYYHPGFDYEEMFTDLGGPWAGHKYFAYDLVRFQKPKRILELGTHLGCSLFSFCQAVKDGNINPRIDAVDTWKGDRHSGKYNEIVYKRINQIKKEKYNSLGIKLNRKTFDYMAKNVSRGSVDLLHIDGMHTYKAVTHDFENWINKVSKNGTILIHDISVKKWGFGIYKFWEEIKREYMTIEFHHSFGLGVVVLDKDKYRILKQKEKIFRLYYPLVYKLHLLKWNLRGLRSKILN